MTTSGISGYNAATGAASTRNGVSGLISNMDTDAIVESMTSNITAKIEKIKQQQQTLGWQQEAYQDIINDLVAFNEKYLSTSSATSLRNPDFFQTAIINALGSNASAVTASGTASSIRDIVIQSVKKLATTASVTTDSGHNVCTQSIDTGLIDLQNGRTVSALEGESISFKYGNKKYTVSLSDVKVAEPSGDDAEDARKNAQYALEALQTGLRKAGLGDSVTASLDGGKIKFSNVGEGGNTLELTGGGTTIMNALGFSPGSQAAAGGSIEGQNKIDDTSSNITTQITFGESVRKGDGTMTIDMDGKQAVIDLKAILDEHLDADGKDAVTMDQLVDGINKQLDDQFGAGKVRVTAKDLDPSDPSKGQGLSFTAANSTSIISIAMADSGVLGKNGAMNVELGAANRLLLYEALESSKSNLGTQLDFSGGKTYGMNINGVDFEIGSDFIKIDGKETKYDNGVNVNDILTAVGDSKAGVNIKYLSTTDRFSISAKEPGSGGKIEIGAMTSSGSGTVGDLSSILFGDMDKATGSKEGTDAEMVVSFDGGNSFDTVVRSSNNFQMDGVNYTLNSTFESSHEVTNADGTTTTQGSGDAIKFSATMNSEPVIKAVKEMTEEYNKLIEKINTAVNTKRDRSYQPLTEAQKKEMSESEIEAWEKKAKEGILFGDSMLRTLASELRFAFSMPISGNSFSSIGISTSTSYSDNGKLVVDEKALKAALEGNPDKVASLFTSTSTTYQGESTYAGAMTTLDSVFTKYAKTTGATKGALVEKAGYKGSALSITNSAIYKQIKTLNNQLDVWKDRLSSARDRYYRQFTNMEMYLNQWNAQAGQFLQQG